MTWTPYMSAAFGVPLILGTMVLTGWWSTGFAGEPIDGFRELKFGMTKQEVVALKECSSSSECIMELSNKNRYVKLSYASPSTTPPSGNEKLNKIIIDMGQFTDDWYQQLQLILGSSYTLTHDINEKMIAEFQAKQLSELSSGYDNGQVVLKVVRRKFGNLVLKVIYQDPALAKAYVQQIPHSVSSP